MESSSSPRLAIHANATTDSNLPTAQELLWATQIKQAALSDPTIVNADQVTDWEFLQHAIVAKDKVPKALQRLRRLQDFKERYGIVRDGSVPEAERDLKIFLQTHPGLYMSLADDDDDVNVDDNAKAINHDQINPPRNANVSSCPQIFCSAYQHFQANRMKSEEAYAVYMRAAFYVLQASQYSLAALRAGIVVVMDTQGAVRYRSYQTEARARELYGSAYPIRLRTVALLNTGAALRWTFRWLLRPWMSAKVAALWQLLPMESSQAWLRQQYSPKSLPEPWGGELRVDDFDQYILNRLRQRYRTAEQFRLE